MTTRFKAPHVIGLVVGLLTMIVIVIGVSAMKPYGWVPDHVVIVVEENLSYDHLVAELEYLSALKRDHAAFTDSHGVDHPSQPNYLALFSGNTQGTGSEGLRNPDGSNPIVDGRTQVGSDEPIKNTPLTTPNLGAALLRVSRTFVGYSEDLPFTGFTGRERVGELGSGIDYQRKHNPWVNWQALSDSALGTNQLPSTTNLPLSAFPTDATGFAELPTVSFVIPNQINDGHKSPAAAPETNYRKTMDTWLKQHIEPYRYWAMTHNSLLIITWDEDEDEYIPVKDQNGVRIAKRYTNRIPTIMAGEGVLPGSYGRYINHYTVLRIIERMYGIAPLSTGDEKAAAMPEAFVGRTFWHRAVAPFR